jgi:uncharacterized protein Yka (UPF0111/DUF47 family)
MHKNNGKPQDAGFANETWQEEQEAGLILSMQEEGDEIKEYVVNNMMQSGFLPIL